MKIKVTVLHVLQEPKTLKPNSFLQRDEGRLPVSGARRRGGPRVLVCTKVCTDHKEDTLDDLTLKDFEFLYMCAAAFVRLRNRTL